MPSETIHNKARSASNFKTRKNSKAPSLREKSNPDVWDPKATNVKCSGVSAAVSYKMGSLLARTAGHTSQLWLRK